MALFLGICALVTFATAARPASSGSSVVAGISVQEAQAAAKSYWDRSEQAWIAGDSSALPALYTGPGLERAKVDLVMKTGNHPDRYPRPFRSVVAYLPESAGSPRWFLVQISFTPVNQDGVGVGYAGQPVLALFVLDEGVWKVYARDFTAPALPQQVIGFGSVPDHYSLPAGKPSAGYVADASTIEQQFIDYENALSRGQKPDGPFPTTYGNYPEAAARVPIYPAGSGSGTSSFELMNDGFRYTGADGSQVALFTVKRSVTASPAKPGACLSQPTGASLSYLYTVSDLIPPGNYAQISSVQLSTVAVSIPRRSNDPSGGRQLVSVAGAGRDVSYQAVKGSCK